MQYWAIKATDAQRITAMEIKYKRKTAGNTWADYKTPRLQNN
jgi:hypothetical protein